MDRGNKNKRPLTSIKCTSLLEWKDKTEREGEKKRNATRMI